MAIIRWDPSRELTPLQSVFNSFFDTPTGANGGTYRRWTPAMDVVATEDAYVLRADLPGLSDEDVSIEVEDGVLKVSGERKVSNEEKGEGYYRVERSFGRFSRTLRLPEGVDADAVTATFDKGVLEVRVPKPEEVKPKKVEITIGSDAS